MAHDFPFTYGIEEEFFVSHHRTRNVATKVPQRLINRAKKQLGEDVVEHELLQCQVELVSPILTTMEEGHAHVTKSRRVLAQLAKSLGLELIAAGTHPLAAWVEQEVTDAPRYDEVLDGFQIIGRRNLLCGLHIHVGIPEGIDRVQLMNRAMRWLPVFLAFSTSSPFWNRCRTGLLSYRQAAFDEWPRSGIPDMFENQAQYDEFASRLVSGGAMKDASFLWWAIRPSLHYPTLELRVADACTHYEDTLAIAALYRSLISFLIRNPEHGKDWTLITRRVIDENRWRAKRYGIKAEFIDDRTGNATPLSTLYEDLRKLVTEDARQLGCIQEFDRLSHLLRAGTSADEQLAVYDAERRKGTRRIEALKHVVDWLAEQTVPPAAAEQSQSVDAVDQ